MKAKKIASQETCFYFDEIWKDVREYEGLYQISNYGRVKGLSKISKWNNRVWKEKILKQRVVKQYKQIRIASNSLNIDESTISKCCKQKKNDSRRLYLGI